MELINGLKNNLKQCGEFMLEVNFTKKLWHFILEANFKIEDEILVLWGASGAGKSTILHCLAGLIKPDNGFIKLNKEMLYKQEAKISLPTKKREIGYLFQDYALFPHLTVKKNILYGTKKKDNSRLINLDILDTFGISHLVNRYPNQLSGGEKQRVALARALSAEPKLLLLDEPFSALDQDTKIKLRQELKNIHKKWKIPFIIVTHDQEDAFELGDSILNINRGQTHKIRKIS